MVSIYQGVLFLAFLIVLLTSIFTTSLFRLNKTVPYLLSIYLLCVANILITGELAGLLSLLDNRLFFLSVHSVLLVVSFFLWKKQGSPSLFLPLGQAFARIKTKNAREYIKKNPMIVLLGLGVGITYLLSMILILVVPPNNYDSMTCHMTRIGYWLQNGNFQPWPTWFTLQVDYPINAQIEVLWSILFWRTDAFSGFTQWFAAIFSMLSVYGIARLMNKSRSQSLFASFIFALFPQILLQSSSTMNHLFGAVFVLIAYYFLFLAFQDRSRLFFIFSGLAIGIGIGVHLIVLILLPGFALTILYLSIKHRKNKLQPIKWMLISSLVSFLLFSSFMYIQNLILWKQPLGRSAIQNPWTPDSLAVTETEETYWNVKNIGKYTFINLSKYIFASYDTTGLPRIVAEPLYDLRDQIFPPFFKLTNIPQKVGEFDISVRVYAVSENWAWCGMIGFLLFYPLIVIELIKSIRKKEPLVLSLIVSVLLYSFMWAGVLVRDGEFWSMYSGRYFVPVTLLFAPLIAMVYQKNWWSKILCGFLIVASCVIAYQTMLNNYAKPLKDSPSIFTWNRADKIYAVSRDQQPIYRAVDAYVPRGRLGIMLTASLMEYPYFGEYFHRTLIPIYPYENVNDKEWLEDQQINWILSCVDIDETPENFEIVENFVLDPPIGISDNCVIYKRQ